MQAENLTQVPASLHGAPEPSAQAPPAEITRLGHPATEGPGEKLAPLNLCTLLLQATASKNLFPTWKTIVLSGYN